MSTGSASLIGQSLAAGRYQILDKLGEGGMGFVYRARDGNLDTDVVIKVPRLAVLESAAFAERFAQEVRSLVRLSHPHIVKVIDVGLHEGLPFAVMQCLGGGSLQSRRPRDTGGRFLPGDPHSLTNWLTSVASALDFVHAQRYIHRDVKPGNILFDEHGNAYLSDFGVAKALAASSGDAHESASLTGTGLVLGTPHYMAPELVMDEPFDGRIDQYALAVTVYEVLTGRFPIEGTTPAAILVGQTTQPPRPLAELLPEAPAALGEALARALSKDPADRFPTCTGFAKHVLAAVSQMPAPPAGAPLPPAAGVAADASTARDAAATAVSVGTVSRGEPGRVACPQCGRALPLSAKMAGRAIRCRPCGATCRVGPKIDELTLLAVGTAEPRTGAISMAETSRIIETVGTAAGRVPTGGDRAGSGAQEHIPAPPIGGAVAGALATPAKPPALVAAKPRDLSKLVLIGVCTAAGVFAAGMLLLLAWSSMRPLDVAQADTAQVAGVEPGPPDTPDESPEETPGNPDEHAPDEGSSGAPDDSPEDPESDADRDSTGDTSDVPPEENSGDDGNPGPTQDDDDDPTDDGAPRVSALIPAMLPPAPPVTSDGRAASVPIAPLADRDSTAPAGPAELRWKLAVGDEFVQEIVEEAQNEILWQTRHAKRLWRDDARHSTRASRRLTITLHWRVVDTDRHGNNMIELTIDRIRSHFEPWTDQGKPLRPISFDSLDETADPISPNLGLLIGMVYRMTLSPRGEVLTLESDQDIVELSGSLLLGIGHSAQWLLSDQLAQALASMTLLPAQPTGVGDTWVTRAPLEIPPMGVLDEHRVTLSPSFRHDGMEPGNFGPLERIVLKMIVDSPHDETDGVESDVESVHTKAEGVVLFDARRGVLQSSRIEGSARCSHRVDEKSRYLWGFSWLITSTLEPVDSGSTARSGDSRPASPAADPAALPAPGQPAVPAPPATPFTRLELPSGAVLDSRDFKVSESQLASYFPKESTFLQSLGPDGNVLAAFTHNEKGDLHGMAVAFHDEKQLSVLAPYRGGKRHGVLRLWNEDGSKQFIASYTNGNHDGIKCLFRDDRPWMVQEWDKSNLEATYLVHYPSEGQAELIACTPDGQSDEAQWQDAVAEAVAALQAYEDELRANEVEVAKEVKRLIKEELDAMKRALRLEANQANREKQRLKQIERNAANAANMQGLIRNAGGR